MRSRDAMRASRSRPNGSTRTARSVTPGVAEPAEARDDRGFVAGGEEVADVGGVAVLEQALVVRRELGVPERAVRPVACGVDLVGAAQRDRDAGHDPRRGPARAPPPRRRGAGARARRSRARRPSRGSSPTRARPRSGASPARARRGGSASGATSVTSRGLCTRKSSFSTSTGPGTRERGVEDLEVVAHQPGRSLVRQPEHVGDDPVVRRTEAEREPPLAHRLVGERLLRHRDRVARLDRHRPRCRARSATWRHP